MRKTTGSGLILLLLLAGIAHTAVVTIDRLEYKENEGYIQLFLPTSQIMPIPDSFYPEKNNPFRLVMRIPNAFCNIELQALKLNSALIGDIRFRNLEAASELEIELKKEVSYDVHTDQNGIYIKFPFQQSVVGEPLAKATTPSPASRISEPIPTGPVVLKDIRIMDQGNGNTLFELILSGKADYSLIPIETNPIRLAVDLRNTRSKKLYKPVNLNNVKAIRGALNTASTYRVVFDLQYMTNYKVRTSGNTVIVEFQKKVVPATPAAEPVATRPESAFPANPLPETPGNGEPKNEPVSAIANSDPVPVLQLKGKDEVESPKEFFKPEKAQVTQEQPPQVSDVTVKTVEGQAQTYQAQSISGAKQYTGEPYDFNFKDTDLVDVLKFIARVAGLNLAIDPDVSGKVTCEFVQVPWDQALDIFLKINRLTMIMDGNLIRIGQVDALQRELENRARLTQAKEMEENLTVVTRPLSFSKGEQIKPILEKQLSARGDIIVDERTNTLIITEIPDRMKVIDKLINTLDAANPQVQIEARIIEATNDFLSSFGVQWGYQFYADSQHGNQTKLVFPNNVQSQGYMMGASGPNKYTIGDQEFAYAVNLPSADSVLFPMLRLGNLAGTFQLDLALSAMERKGKGRVISSPKTTTQNNMKATVVQGELIPIQTIQNNTITIAYHMAALKLEVTPQITAKGSVILEVKINNDTANFEKQVGGIPTINTEEASTIVQVNDGGTIVIGGLYKLIQSNLKTGVPILSDIPILGSMFRNSRRSNEQRELIIFITPRIIK